MSASDTVLSENCTTRWPDTVGCHIPMSGKYTEKYTNLMIMTGNEQEIQDWLSENSTKVVEINEAEGDQIGQTMMPEGTTTITEEYEDNKLLQKTYTAGEFTIAGGQEWTLTDTLDITP